MVANKLNEQKRQHRERAQPLHRKKLGLLEKHADYVKRARDFHSKEKRIQTLKEKAAMRNKDEFYHAMVNKKTKNGVHIQSRGNEPLPVDLVKVLKNQDAGYIRSQLTMEQNRVRRLEEQLASLVDQVLPQVSRPKSGGSEGKDQHVMDEWDMYSDEDDDLGPVASGSGSGRTHVVFSDDLEAVRSADPSTLLQKRPTPTSLPTSALRQLRRELASTTASNGSGGSSKGKGKGKAVIAEQALEAQQRELEALEIADQAAEHRLRLSEELEARRDRLLQLRRAMRELEMQKVMMSKGARKEVVSRKGGKDRQAEQDEWWLQGGKPGKGGRKGAEDEDRAGLPMAEEGVATGARVWKFKAQRKR
ncbi:hypothetical protein JCM10212_004875 [Sporobolomyces blumeae]